MRLKSLLPLFVLALCALAVPAAHAQNGVYVEYTGTGLNMANTSNFYGPTVGVYVESTHAQVLSAGVDFRASFLNGNGNDSLDSGQGGFRLVVRPRALPISPYGEILIGVANSTIGTKSTTDFQSSLVVGMDYTIVPHLDWRVIEFSYGQVDKANAFNPTSFSTGVVLRFR